MPNRTRSEEDRQLTIRLGERVKARRLELGLKGPRDLARRIDPENNESLGQNISAFERGNYLPRMTLLMQIAKGLDTTLSGLLEEQSEDEAYGHGYRQALLDVGEQVSALLRR